ncbi:ankyrin repeat domain-containing protein SOWAHB [Strigops habroptila]|uniref:Sosondowah ankyrin repeat domain family member B n=1 Tax=Strigops habroptila TaxID=2489341 RepID=A0A672UCI9_STRHB|nr:ankyrin repeat domain-containing protein SOWAHB [Strigops habroptila]
MARELSQEAVLDFLWEAGGRAPNTALLRHFQRFLRDPALTESQQRERREYFKSLVNSLATVHPGATPGASKDIVLRRRYRDLLDEEVPPPEEHQKEKEPPPPRRDPDRQRGPPGEAVEKKQPGGGQPSRAAVAGGCSARGRGGLCCECRRARRAAAASPRPGPASPAGPPHSRSPPPPYRTRPLSSGPWTLHPDRPPRCQPPALTPAVLPPYQTPQPPSARQSRCRSPPLSGGLPPSGSAPSGSLPPQHPGGSPPTRALPLPPAHRVLPPDRPPQPQPPPQPFTEMPLLKAPPPSSGPGGRPRTRPPQSPLLPSGPRALSATELALPRSPQSLLAEAPPSRSLPLLSAPGVLPLSRSLQALRASTSSFPQHPSGPNVLPATRLPPAQSGSMQHLFTSPAPLRSSRVLAPNGPSQPQALLPHPCQTLPLSSRPGALSPTRPPPPQSPPQSSTQPLPARPLPSQSLMKAKGPAGPQALESNPPAPPPVFRSIRCQLALLEVQGSALSLPDDCGRQPRTLHSKSSPRHVPGRGLLVPLGQREHAWLVAVSAGRWARVRGLFLEEPELALQRDFMSGFTILHWLAKHGDGPGLQELAAAARQAGLALDVDARSGCGYTPLHLAAIHGHQLVIKVLVLQLGCQVQLRDSSGRRPWEYLSSATSGEIWQLLEAPRGTIMFPTQPLARSVSSVSKGSLPAGRAALPACLRPQHGRGAASYRTGSESD